MSRWLGVTIAGLVLSIALAAGATAAVLAATSGGGGGGMRIAANTSDF